MKKIFLIIAISLTFGKSFAQTLSYADSCSILYESLEVAINFSVLPTKGHFFTKYGKLEGAETIPVFVDQNMLGCKSPMNIKLFKKSAVDEVYSSNKKLRSCLFFNLKDNIQNKVFQVNINHLTWSQIDIAILGLDFIKAEDEWMYKIKVARELN